ncbi:MAG: hypothetical protein J6V25_11600 [Oscillospiraceae bacterium]|nr:hypothetical protein [Oscillospiraceae bacterium]
MFKKKLVLILAAVLALALFSGCCLSHEWQDATCETPKTCAKCDKTEGEALGHSWQDATCEAAKTCAVCAKTEGAALGHSWQNATCEAPKTCSTCAATEGEALDHEISWSQLNSTTMEGICAGCGGSFTEDMNWELVGPYHVVGNWTATKLTTRDSNKFIDLPSGSVAQLWNDGTGILTLAGDDFELLWSFDRVEANDNYTNVYTLVYDFSTGDEHYQMMITEGLSGTAYLFMYIGNNILVLERG